MHKYIVWHACEKPLKTQICECKRRTSYLSVSLIRRATTVFVPVLKEWTSADWSFSSLKDMGCQGCAVTFLDCHSISWRFWPCKPGFCYSEFLSVLLNILQSAAFLWSLHVLHRLLLWFSWCLIAFLPSVFQTQFIQVGSVCLGNTQEKI